MANKPDPDKQLVGIRMPRETWRKLQVMAKDSDHTPNTLAASILTSATEKVSLTAEDYEQIAKDTRAAAEKNRRTSKTV